MIRILIVDDHKLLAEALASLFDGLADLRVIGHVSNGLEAVRKVREHRPDVVVMDLSMPVLNGVEATERITRECPETRILCLTMHADSLRVDRMLKAGAKGYVLKSAAYAELVQAVRSVAAGSCYLSPDITAPVISGFVSPRQEGDKIGDSLSLREREILQLVAEGLSSKEIAKQLNLSIRTVENHRRHISARLGLKSVAALTKYAIRHGLTGADF